MAKNNYELDLERVAIRSITNQINFAYLSILQDSCDFVNGEIGENFNMDNSEILKISEFVKKSVGTLEDLLSLDDHNKEDIVDQILKHKKTLISKYETFCTYLNQYNLLLFSVEEASSKQYLKENPVKDIDFSKFFNDCYKFIQATEDENERNYRICQVVKYIPLTMTKEKYFDYVRQSVTAELNGLSEITVVKFLNLLKEDFTPEVSKEYDVLFPEIIEKMEHYKDLLKTNLSEVELELLSEKINAINDDLTSISQYLYILFKDLNYLMILLSMGFDMEFIGESNPVYLDLYKTASMVLDDKTTKEDKEIYAETLVNVLDTHINDVIEVQEKVADVLEQLMDKYDDKYDDTELEGLINTQAMFRMYINKELNDDIYSDVEDNESPIASKDYLKEKLEELIEFLRKQIQPMTVKERKIHMQNFLGRIHPIWDEEECLDYIDMSMNNASFPESKLLAMSRIGNVMDAKGFFEEQQEHEQHEEHEHHHHHEHHHDDDCDCGHDHHHHH